MKAGIPQAESQRVSLLLDALLREDVAGLRTRGRRTAPGLLVVGRLRVPVRAPGPGDLLADLVVREPWLGEQRGPRVVRHRRLPAVVRALGRGLAAGDAELAAGLAALEEEALAALAADRLRRRSRPRVLPAALRRNDFETVAAFGDHPFHPLSTARVGLRPARLAASAPEHAPIVVPRWLALPAAAGRRVETHGRLPDWWPAVDGVPAVPMHPATDPATLDLPAGSRLLPADLPARPTLSMRTLALLDHPGEQLKLPMPVRTLGRRSRRRLGRPGLHDAATMHDLLGAVLAEEPGWAERVAIADESTWVWAGHPMLAAALRRVPSGTIVPVAALAVSGVARMLAGRFFDGDLNGFLREYLTVLLGWHLDLWLRHGIVLEAHQQNVALTLGPGHITLLQRDLDSGRVAAGRQRGRVFADPRVLTGDGGELADLLTTTTLHQCAAAVLVAVAGSEKQPPERFLAMLGSALGQARVTLSGTLDDAALAPLDRIAGARRLPAKCLVTATTLLPPGRTGAADATKYYGADAPSYLLIDRSPHPQGGFDAGRATGHALVRCLAREVAAPAGRATLTLGRLVLHLGAHGRLEVAAQGLLAGAARPHGPVNLVEPGGRSRPIGWSELAKLTEKVLTELTGNVPPDAGLPDRDGLSAQVRQSHALMAAARLARPGPIRSDGFLAAEQSLSAGHGHHPAPKARGGEVAEALRYAPEAGTAFPLHYLAVRQDAVWSRACRPLLDSLLRDDVDLPPGHVALPVHPWQLARLRRDPATAAALAAALADGRLRDLGPGRRRWRPTASVRTVTHPQVPGFVKLALGVRITNCVRLNPRPELHAAVRLTERLPALLADLAETCPAATVLAEPEGRTVTDPVLADQLGVLARQGLPSAGAPHPGLDLPAAALCEPVPLRSVAAVLHAAGADEGRLIAWWRAYLGLLLRPVWRSLTRHGVVFEAHLQNVVIRLDREGFPVGVVLRDLEGAKLVPELVPGDREWIRDLPPDVAAHLLYPPGQAWRRAAYCLLVNHVATVLGVLVDGAAGGEELEHRLWREVGAGLLECRQRDGDLPGEPLGAVLAGGPVPAKTNLLTRWHDRADRESGYTPLPLPLSLPVPAANTVPAVDLTARPALARR